MALTYKVMCIQGIERATITKEFDAGEVVSLPLPLLHADNAAVIKKRVISL